MRISRELYQIEQMITQQFPDVRPAHVLGLALWVYGTVLAKSACLSAVVVELCDLLSAQTARQRLREWLRNGRDKARPCDAQVDVTACFPFLLRWVVQWWQGTTLPLAIDATHHHDRVVALVISVLYRGCAIPVAWHIVPATQQGAWMPHILALIEQLAPEVPRNWQAFVCVDRGLWSPASVAPFAAAPPASVAADCRWGSGASGEAETHRYVRAPGAVSWARLGRRGSRVWRAGATDRNAGDCVGPRARGTLGAANRPGAAAGAAGLVWAAHVD